jgi:hypothetical protein
VPALRDKSRGGILPAENSGNQGRVCERNQPFSSSVSDHLSHRSDYYTGETGCCPCKANEDNIFSKDHGKEIDPPVNGTRPFVHIRVLLAPAGVDETIALQRCLARIYRFLN